MFLITDPPYIRKRNMLLPSVYICLLLAFCFFIVSTPLKASGTNLRFTHITVEDGLSQNTINGIIKDKYGFMWFATWEGVSKYDGYSFRTFNASEDNGLVSNRISNIYLDANENIWVTDGNGSFSFYDYLQETFTTVVADSVSMEVLNGLKRELYKKHSYNGTDWLIVDKDSVLFASFQDGSTKSYYKSLFDDFSLNDENLTDIFIDEIGVIWVGTESSGVNKADIGAKPFYNYKSIPFNVNSLVDNVVRAVHEDKNGNLWIGTTNKGVTKIAPSGNYTHFIHRVDVANSIIDNRIRHLFSDHLGNIWMGTRGGLTIYSPEDDSFRSYTRFVSPALPHNSVYWIMEDHNQVIWIATFNGLVRYVRNEDRFVTYQSEDLINNTKVRCVFEDSRHWLWIGTEGGGISVLKRGKGFSSDGQLQKIKEFTYTAKGGLSIPSNLIHLIKEDKEGMMWIGTNKGLCRLNPETGDLFCVNRETGFPDDLIMGIEFDDKNNVWVSHKKGLTKITFDEKDQMFFRTYTVSDGLQGNEFSHNASEYGPVSKKMFFGGSKGLTAFYPDSIKDNLSLPNTLISELRINNQKVGINEPVNGKVVLTKSILNTTTISIDHTVKSIGIGFVGLHYSNPKSNQYQYMLEGFDEEWIRVNASHRLAGYSNLDPGIYTFKVKSSNCDGIWNPVPAKLEIIVLPPWWKTNWAYSIYIALMLIAIGSIFHFVRWRERLKHQLLIEKLKKEHEQELNKEKTEFYTLVSHELRTPLSLIIDPLEQITSGSVPKESETGILKLMLQNAKRMKQLLSQLLEFSKIDSDINAENSKEGDLLTSIRQVYNSFVNQAEKRNIHLQFLTNQPAVYCVFDEDKMQKIVTNLLSNAIKYTPDNGAVSMDVSYHPEDELSKLTIVVSDTGIGIPDEEKEQVFNQFYQRQGIKPFKGDSVGLGLSIVKKLVETLKGTIKIEDNNPKGSRFIVSMYLKPIMENMDTVSEAETTSSGLLEHVLTNNEKSWILLVDDNKEIVGYLKEILSSYYNVTTAYDGESALKWAISEVPDLIISDVMMPGMNGMELCEQIKRDERTSHVPVILLTAKGGEEVQIEAYEKGADIYHEKPFNSKLLIKQIQSLLKNRSVFKDYIAKSSSSELTKGKVNSVEYEYVNNVIELISQNIQNSQFGPDMLADLLAVSKRQLYRKVKALTDQTVHELITGQRMIKAKELLKSKKYSIAEVAFQVGYSEASNFSRTFTKHFQESPSKYQKRVGL